MWRYKSVPVERAKALSNDAKRIKKVCNDANGQVATCSPKAKF